MAKRKRLNRTRTKNGRVYKLSYTTRIDTDKDTAYILGKNGKKGERINIEIKDYTKNV